MLKAINLRKFLTSLIPSLLTGLLGWFFTRNSINIYERIVSPPLSPPTIIFPIVWSLLYFLMGVSFYLVVSERRRVEAKSIGYKVYIAQLVFNFLWSIFFFNLGLYEFSAVWLGVLILLIAINIYCFCKVNSAAAYLIVPYIAWCLFALYLNIGIAVLN